MSLCWFFLFDECFCRTSAEKEDIKCKKIVHHFFFSSEIHYYYFSVNVKVSVIIGSNAFFLRIFIYELKVLSTKSTKCIKNHIRIYSNHDHLKEENKIKSNSKIG